MKTINYTFNQLKTKYDLSQMTNPDTALFVDIETTGFSFKNASIYLIGVCYVKEGIWKGIQWFAEHKTEESLIIDSFFQFAKTYSTLIHFNGNKFDLPFILGRCEKLGLCYDFNNFEGIDIYKRIAPCKHFLQLPNCKQKTIEHFLHIYREDTYNGGELVSIYKEYLKKPSEKNLNLLLMHNRDDLQGMPELLPVLAYTDIFNRQLKVTKIHSNYYRDFNGVRQQELIIYFTLPSSVPVSLSYHANDCYVTLEDNLGTLRVPVYTEELKYFYSNYKDYYYLPLEDIAIHKSVASFVDKEHRIPATAATCYSRKFSSYLPQWDYIFEPFFKREYKDSILFFELTVDLKTDKVAFSKYVSHLLNMLGKTH